MLSSVLAYQASSQTTQYYDNNGTGTPTSGNWDNTTANWATSSTLTASTGTFTNGNFAAFAGGSTTISALTIAVPGAITCEGIGDGEPSGAAVTTLTFSGAGSINFPTGAWNIDCGASANDIVIDVPITGPGGIIQHNSGSLSLYGNNTYSGGTTETGDQIIYYNNNNSFGTGIITNYGGNAIFLTTNLASDVVTITNPFYMNIGSGSIWDFGNGNTICSGPDYLYSTTQLKNNGASGTALIMSGPISSVGGAYGLDLETPSGGTMTLSGANTYTGPTAIGDAGTATVYVSSINSVSSPAQQASSSLGKPSSIPNGIITIGNAGYTGTLIYTGPGETTDRNIDLGGTTGGAVLEMDGAGPLVINGYVGVGSGDNGAKTFTLQGSSTAANTIAGSISNSTSATSFTKAQAGSWTLTGTNRFTGTLTISAGTLTIGGSGDLGGGSFAGAFSDAGTFNYNSSAGQTLSGALSGTGAFNVGAPAGTSVTLSDSSSTFTGLYTINSGTLAISADTDLGTAPSTALTNDITLNGGPGASFRVAASALTINANRGIYLGANGGSFQIASGDTCTYNGIISGIGQFQNGQNSSTGLGTLVLGGSEAYTNTTVLALGTLRLSASASIGNSSGILFSNSPTLDVSAFSAFALSTTNTVTVIGASNTPTAPATILGAASGTVNFGSQTVNLSYAPSLTNGDALHSVLTVSQSSLVLDGNTFNVTNASGSTLDVGDYALVQCTNGFNITSPLTLNYIGNLAPNTTPTLTVISNNLVLQVVPAAGYANSTFTNQSPYPSQSWVYGTPSFNVYGEIVGATGTYAAQNETVTIVIPNVSTNTTTIFDNNGDFAATIPLNTVPVGTYAVTLSYAGPTQAPALDTSIGLTITKAGVTVTAAPQTKIYGQTLPSGTGQTAFTATGLQNGETIGSVTLTFSGTPAGNTATAGTNNYGITPSAATGGTFTAGNYSITYVTNILSVSQLPVGLMGTRVYDGTATATYSILSITNIVSGDTVSLASGNATLASSAPGPEPIISTALTLSGARDTNYTTIGAAGVVTVTVNASSTNVVFSATNGQMTLSWPLDHTGWELQAQTNSDLTVGLTTTNWVDVTGSTTTNLVNIPINVTNGSVFYRLVYPPQ